MLTMRKILCRALLCLCLVLALAPVPAAYAQDLDRIESYDVDVTPDTQDGSLRIQVTLEWTVLAEGPVSWVKIGVPNGSIREETALTDNIDRLMDVFLTRIQGGWSCRNLGLGKHRRDSMLFYKERPMGPLSET